MVSSFLAMLHRVIAAKHTSEWSESREKRVANTGATSMIEPADLWTMSLQVWCTDYATSRILIARDDTGLKSFVQRGATSKARFR